MRSRYQLAFMDYKQAKFELARHAGLTDISYRKGFVGCLRPYCGLHDENFHTVIQSLLIVGDEFASSERVERCVVGAMFSITVTARRWGVDEDGMLVRNRLISPEDRDMLRRWIEIIETMLMDLLRGLKPHDAIHAYCEYVAQYGWGENATWFVPLLAKAIESDDVGDRLQGHCAAIAALGPAASSLSAVLTKARQREWDWYEPYDRCAAEMRGHIDHALAAIQTTSP